MKLTRPVNSTVAVVGIAALLAACSPSTESRADEATAPGAVDLTVLGAASTRVVNEQLAQLTDHHLEFVNAGSSTLVQQLVAGSPGDLLITADQASMDRAVDEGVVTGPAAVASNSMVMVVPAGNPADITGVDESLAGANVVLCDPQVPCGTVSQQIMDTEGIEIEAASLEHSVSDTLGKVASGEADAGWVYRTDARAAGDAVEVFTIPGAGQVPNTLYAAVTGNAAHPVQARELRDLLTGTEMAGVWEDNGFTPVA